MKTEQGYILSHCVITNILFVRLAKKYISNHAMKTEQGYILRK